MWRAISLTLLVLLPARAFAQATPAPGEWTGSGDQGLVVRMTVERGSVRWFEIAFTHRDCRTQEYAVAHIPIANGAFAGTGTGNILFTTIRGQFSSQTSASGTIDFSWVGCGTGRLQWSARLGAAAPPVTQPPPTSPSPPAVCPVSNVSIDDSLINGAATIEVVGAGCERTLNIRNQKNYWTNFVVSTIGPIDVALISDHNPNAEGLLPPAGILALSPLPIAYRLTIRGPGAVSVLVDPTTELSHKAAVMNVTQVILGFIPGSGGLVFGFEAVTTIENAFARMPHLQAAAQNLMSPNPNRPRAIVQLTEFALNGDEWAIFGQMLLDLGVSLAGSLWEVLLDVFLGSIFHIAETIGYLWHGFEAGSLLVQFR